MALAIFDLDGTILDINSGRLWLLSEWKSGFLKLRHLGIGAVWLVRYSLGQDGLDAMLDQAAAVYAGASEAEVIERNDRWFETEIKHHIRQDARQRIEQHRLHGDTLVLATTSSQYLAHSAARALGFDTVLSTELEVIDGRLTGAIARSCYGPHKLARCRDFAQQSGESLEDAVFYSDSYSDLPVLSAVGKPVIVAPDSRLKAEAHKRGWEVVSWAAGAA